MRLQLFHLLMHSGKLLEDRVREGLKESGIHHGQGRILCALARRTELSQIDIADGLGIQRATVTNMLQRMEKSGLIKRSGDKNDQRVRRVRLTAAGRRAEQTVRGVWDDIEKDIRAALSPKMIAPASQCLLKIRGAFGGADPKV